MDKITRTITSFTISASIVKFDTTTQTTGLVPLPPVVASGEKMDEEKATKIVKKEHKLKDVPFVVTGIENNSATYEISLDDFLKYAKRVEPKAKTTSPSESDK